ncbi:hypothetical protein [Nostoc sp.]|uniref:hypothetical protein n=1 Tax=Nostoc sp. TaxID=1180 RepID=UPI002FFC1CB7
MPAVLLRVLAVIAQKDSLAEWRSPTGWQFVTGVALRSLSTLVFLGRHGQPKPPRAC